jgi:HSP20 family protein
MVRLATEGPYGNIRRQHTKGIDPSSGIGYYNFCGADTWSPPVNLYETETAYLVCVDLAGVDKEKIDIEVLAGELTLRGNRLVPAMHPKTDRGESRLRVHLMEIDHGSFCRSVELPPDAARDEINATYRDGLLWIEIPKKA